jgi:hypothetical protein
LKVGEIREKEERMNEVTRNYYYCGCTRESKSVPIPHKYAKKSFKVREQSHELIEKDRENVRVELS